MTEAVRPRRRYVTLDTVCEESEPGQPPGGADWRQPFLEVLAQTSSVSASAEAAGVNRSLVYRTRRQDTAFAAQWQAALHEGYEHLEMETLHRLRMGTSKDDPKFDIANALRLLALRRDMAERDRGERLMRDEEAILASLEAKLDLMRSREENVTRLLNDQVVNVARPMDGNE